MAKLVLPVGPDFPVLAESCGVFDPALQGLIGKYRCHDASLVGRSRLGYDLDQLQGHPGSLGWSREAICTNIRCFCVWLKALRFYPGQYDWDHIRDDCLQ